MGWDEHLFGMIFDGWRAIAPKRQAQSTSLDSVKQRLEAMGAAFLGSSLRVEAEAGAWLCYRDLLVLPPSLSIFSDPALNVHYYKLRLLFYYGALGSQNFGKKGEGRQEAALRACDCAADCISFLNESFPKFQEGLDSIVSQLEIDFQTPGISSILLGLWDGKKIPPKLLAILPTLPLNQNRFQEEEKMSYQGHRPRTLNRGASLKAKTVANPRLIESDSKQDNPLTHVFEKVLTADNYQGGSKNLDGSDESKDHGEAVNELTLDSIIRTGRDTHTYLKSDAEIEAAFQMEEMSRVAAVTYPEWFHKERAYRSDWCSLQSYCYPINDRKYPKLTNEEVGLVKKTTDSLVGHFNHPVWRNRQPDGEQFDLDALVRWAAEREVEGPIQNRLFRSQVRLERRVSVLVLLDTSLSTDSWVGDRRVLSSLVQCLRILCCALKPFSGDFGVATFHSFSRNDCRFGWLKTFDDPVEILERRLCGVEPEGYTRMGVAVRHATAELLERNSRNRALIYLGDGKPTDYDHYEGTHGHHDVRKAIQEAQNSEVSVQGVLFAEAPKNNMTETFGSQGYCVATSPDKLVFNVLSEFLKHSLKH